MGGLGEDFEIGFIIDLVKGSRRVVRIMSS